MKRFYYTISKETNSRTYGGSNVTADVYKQTRDGMQSIGEVSWCTRSYKGEESEVFTFLIEKGELPKKCIKYSVSPCVGEGYYRWDYKEKYGISIERL